ncbi:putative quinic acid utilization activator [Rosellinia necatrix]|uniref:Putative quinic acid utilization activator n=1 Tax=Rosellinia necatrix TaxID=77044 RepID=A0A1S7UMP8_ROSNE|nr:putative quinic acid utilization activator [Rosellinia necatrix]
MGPKRQSGREETRTKSTAERPSGEAAPKRQRVSRACDQCRAAREKCDGIQPLCFPCASQNRPCSWEEPKKKRGVQTGYIRTLEMALGWIFDKIPETEDALHGLLTHEGGQGRMLLAGKDTSAGTRLHRRWRKSTVHAEIERVLSGDAASARSANDSTPGEESDEDGPEKDLPAAHDARPTSSLLEPADRMKVESEIPDRTQPGTQWHEDLTTPEDSRTSLLRSPPGSRPSLQPQPQPQPLRPSTVALPSNHWRLLDIYFSYTHIWFPILEKSELLKTGYSYPEDGLNINRETPGSAGHAELWAALALASFQEAAGRGNESPEGASPTTPFTSPIEIYHIARDLIPVEDGVFEARHINALLLLALVNLACNDLRASWMLIGMASRVALSLRLHEDSGSTRYRQSSHTYMGCFILDTLVSARMGLPPHLRSSTARISLPRLNNDLDEWQPWMPCSNFGPSQNNMRPSRMPSHSISSFGVLHSIHLALSRQLWDEPKHSPPAGDAFIHTLQNAVTQCSAEASLSNCILTGERMAGQLPSIYLLRLAFLGAAGVCKGFPYLHRAALSCVESYMNSFGVCGLSPLVPVFMKLVNQQTQHDALTGEERARWNRVEKATGSVWTKSSQNHEPGAGFGEIHSPYHPQSANTPFGSGPKTPSQQSLANSLFHSNTNISHGSTSMGIPFSPDPNSEISELVTHHPPPEAQTLRLSGTPAAVGEFGDIDTLAISPSMHYPGHARPNFNSAALDYDTILDDIASFDRANVPESDTQFMANLGLRPGTNLADVFSHEFMGFS